jgi:hypothetical protein
MRLRQSGVDGVDLVDHGVGGIKAGEPVPDQVPREGEGVEDVPEVHDEHSDRDCRQRFNAGDHADEQQFKRPRERG